MASARDALIRDQLHDRRHRLSAALTGPLSSAGLRNLLEEVDAALARLEAGSYGLCEVCHDPVEDDRLMADPLLRFCLDHLTAAEQRALQQDLDLSARIQAELLPQRRLAHGGWEADYHFEPLGPVSGDCCDIALSPDGSFFFLVGDVVGKGVAASMLMSHLHAIFRSLLGLGLPLGELMQRANRVFCESIGSGRYATLVCGRADAAGRVEVANAGHCPPLVLRASGAESLAATGLPVGLFCSSPYAVSELRLSPGESLLLYTDGVSEARDRSGAEYGATRLTGAAAARGTAAPWDLIAACLADLAAFRAGSPAADDLTLMALRRSGPAVS